MYSQQSIEYAFNKISALVDKYHKYAYGFYMDWQEYETYTPHSDEKRPIWLPQVAIEFVH